MALVLAREGGELTRQVILDYGRVRDGELEIIFDYRDAFRRQRVPIVTTACNYGGSRSWFQCVCGRRVGVLFDGVSAFVCRQCLGLGYACSSRRRAIGQCCGHKPFDVD